MIANFNGTQCPTLFLKRISCHGRGRYVISWLQRDQNGEREEEKERGKKERGGGWRSNRVRKMEEVGGRIGSRREEG